MKRCEWSLSDPIYIKYHDEEWGVPVHEDRKLFEFLILEGAQAGLSWLTVLKKRDNYRQAFDRFDPERVARYDTKKMRTLLSNPGIIRNRLKVNAAITNARAFLDVQEREGSFDRYIWSFVDGRTHHNRWKTLKQLPCRTPVSDALSKDLRRRGFTFVGSLIMYAHMQATGMVNDHLVSCFRHAELRPESRRRRAIAC